MRRSRFSFVAVQLRDHLSSTLTEAPVLGLCAGRNITDLAEGLAEAHNEAYTRELVALSLQCGQDNVVQWAKVNFPGLFRLDERKTASRTYLDTLIKDSLHAAAVRYPASLSAQACFVSAP